jgi:hypothetical protein
MHRSILILSLAVAFLSGCVVTMAARDLVVPPARAGTNPTRWEHRCYTTSLLGWQPYEDLNRLANEAGRKGWAISGGPAGGGATLVCFKRPLS